MEKTLGSQLGTAYTGTRNNESISIFSRALDICTTNVYSICFIFLLLSSFTAHSIVINGEDAVGTKHLQDVDSNAVFQFVYIAIFLAVVARSYYINGASFLVKIPLFFCFLLVWCWMSLTWAVDPAIALRRTVLLTITTLTVTYSVKSLPYTKVISLLAWSLAFMLIADWISIALFPLAIHNDVDLAGSWRGIHNHKNEAGALSALSAILFVHMTIQSRSMFCGPITILLSSIFLYMTASKTSIGFVGLAICIGAFSNYIYHHPKIRIAMLVIITTLIVVSLAFFGEQIDQILSILDDPSAFTGRTKIWPIVINYAADHPLLGAGYGSFWNIGSASPLFDYAPESIIEFYAQAHNGYLNLLVQVGAVGLILAIMGLVVYPLYILYFRPLHPDVSRSLICAVIAFGCLHNLLESSFFDNSPIWLIMLTIYCLLSEAVSKRVEWLKTS